MLAAENKKLIFTYNQQNIMKDFEKKLFKRLINQSLVQIYSYTLCYVHISVLHYVHKRLAAEMGTQNTDMPFIIDRSTCISE